MVSAKPKYLVSLSSDYQTMQQIEIHVDILWECSLLPVENPCLLQNIAKIDVGVKEVWVQLHSLPPQSNV